MSYEAIAGGVIEDALNYLTAGVGSTFSVDIPIIIIIIIIVINKYKLFL
jgi:hypothetical protein